MSTTTDNTKDLDDAFRQRDLAVRTELAAHFEVFGPATRPG